MAGDAFLANQTSTDGATRDAKGALKFNKNTKRSRETEREYEMTFGAGIIDQDDGKVRKKKKEVTKLGEEFRSKVSNITTTTAPSPITSRYHFPTTHLPLSSGGLMLMRPVERKRRRQETRWTRSILLCPHRPSST